MENQTNNTVKQEFKNVALTSTNEQTMQTAGISEITRGLLIIIGKISDVHDNIYDCIEEMYGETQVDALMKLYVNHLNNLRDEVEGILIQSIRENMGLIDWKDI